MSTAIEWTDETWNPTGGCDRISPGCAHCYAKEQWDRRHKAALAGKAMAPQYLKPFEVLQLFPDRLLEPLKWKRPRRVFVNSVSDLFHEDVPDAFIDKVFDVMWRTPRHTYQILTKRPERMVDYVSTRAARRAFGWTEQDRPAMRPGDFHTLDDIRMRNMCGYVGDGDYACDHPNHGGEDDTCDIYECPVAVRVDEREKLRIIGVENGHTYGTDGYAEDSEWMELTDRPVDAACGNVWFGFSAENQKLFDERFAVFQRLRWELGPHFTLFASLEPLLSGIELGNALSRYDFSDGGGPCHVPFLNWVIVGGESGPGARPCRVQWVRDVVAQCKSASIPVFVKQLGARTLTVMQVVELHDRKGGNPDEWPADLRVREWPEVRALDGKAIG